MNLGTKLAGMAALRDKVAKELYAGLSAEEKAQWEEQAKEEHVVAVNAWKEETEGSSSTDPADRQKCIYGLVNFMQPILDLVCEATGWTTTLMAGGPEPAHSGHLNVISIHSSTTTGDVPMNFGHAERLRYKQTIIPIFGQFLQRCYSLEECQVRVLLPTEGFEGVESMDVDMDDVDFDSIKTNTPAASLFSAPTTSTASSNSTSVASTNSEPGTHHLRTSTPSCSPSPGPTPALSRPPSPPSPPLSLQHSPSPDPPMPASISSILDKVTPPSPGAQSLYVTYDVALSDSDVASPLSLPIPASASNSRGRKRQTDPITSHLPASKRNHITGGTSKAAPLPGSPSMKARNTASRAVTAKHNRVAVGTQSSTPVTLPLPQSYVAPPLTQATRSMHTATRAPLLSAPGCTEPPPTVSLVKFNATHDAPIWFSNAVAMFQSNDTNLGDSWSRLIGLWVAFEIKEDYGHDLVGKLKAKNRPTVLKDWIQRARSTTWRPINLDVAALENDFGNWWTSLQPEWRVEENGQLDITRINSDWELLRQPGVNGLLSAVAGLFFWGLVAHTDAAARVAWLRSINDCIVMLDGLLTAS